MLDADHRAGYGIGVVTVDAPELDGAAVQEHHVVLNMDGPEADAVSNDFVGSFQDQGVQVRLFGIPEGGILHREDCLMGVGTAIKHLNNTGSDRLVSCIQQLYLGGDILTVVGKPDADGGFFFIQQCGGEVVPDAVFGTLQDVHIPEDAGGTELVLIFQIAAVTPLQDQNCQSVLSFFDSLGDVKLRGGVGDFAVAQEGAVEPDVEAGVNTLEVQVGLGSICIAFIDKIVQVSTAGIFIRNIGRVCREGIADVGVLVLVVTVVLPNAGDGDHIPAGCIVVFVVELIFEVVDALAVPELPVVI